MTAEVDEQAAASTETGITATHTSGEQTNIHPIEVFVQFHLSFFPTAYYFFLLACRQCTT